MPKYTAEQYEQVFHVALAKGDEKGVQAALVGLALVDPHRAQDLLDITKLALKAAADPTLRPTLMAAIQPFTPEDMLRAAFAAALADPDVPVRGIKRLADRLGIDLGTGELDEDRLNGYAVSRPSWAYPDGWDEARRD